MMYTPPIFSFLPLLTSSKSNPIIIFQIRDAFNCLGFSDEEQMWILNTTAAVLLLGNLTFKAGNNDCAVIENPEVNEAHIDTHTTQIAHLICPF